MDSVQFSIHPDVVGEVLGTIFIFSLAVARAPTPLSEGAGSSKNFTHYHIHF